MKKYDVIVAGGGTAGVFAALSAAREGMKVLLLEKNTACGGIGGDGAAAPYYDRNDLALSIDLDMETAARQQDAGFLLPLKNNCISTELMKGTLERHLIRSGVKVIYQAVVTGVEKKGKLITGVSWHDREGKHSASATVTIDATADGILLLLAGANFLPGRQMDNARQPYSRIFTYLADGKLWNYGGDAGYIDPDDPEKFTGECLRSAAGQMPEAFMEKEKRFGYSPLAGVREGRHLAGVQTIRFKEVIRGIQYSSPVAWEYANFDSHSIDMALEDDEVFLFSVVAMQWGTRMNIAIPLGALIPAGLDGIIAAGRMISADHAASQAVRMKGCMKHIGAVAGVLAAVATKHDVPVSAVSPDEITGVLPAGSADEMLRYNEELWMKEPDEIREYLRRKNPGSAIWSAYLLGKKEYLYDLLNESDFARNHAAFALALMHDDKALPVLRELAGRRDETFSETLRNEPVRESHGVIATYLLGYLDDMESFSLLKEIFTEKRDFFFTAAAWRSIIRMANKNACLRESAGRFMRKFLAGDDVVPGFTCYCGELYDASGKIKALTGKWLKSISGSDRKIFDQ